jgi:transcriptional regulator with XRE-family HTH domain
MVFMLGQFIKQWRYAKGLTQQEMAAKLTSAGWEMGGTRLSVVEREDGKGAVASRSQVKTVAKATGESEDVVAFWGGLHSVDFSALPDAPLNSEDVELGMALLKWAVGVPGTIEPLPEGSRRAIKGLVEGSNV